MTLEEAEKEIKELRDENAKHRLKNRELADQVSTVTAERDKLATEKDALSQSVVKLTADADQFKADTETKITELTKANQEKIKVAEVAALAIKEGLVDRDGLKLADLSKVEFNDDGTLKGADDVIKALKESKPYLFGKAISSSNTDGKPKHGETNPKNAKEMTDEEYQEERSKLLKT